MKHLRAGIGLDRGLAILAVLAAVGMSPLTPCLTAGEEADAKGMYLRQAKAGIKFNVLLDRDGRETPVSSGHHFRSGDRMRFLFELNSPAYVYVVHREIKGDPSSSSVSRYAGQKGIRFVHSSSAARTKPPAGARQTTGTTEPRETVSPPPAVEVSSRPSRYKLLFPSTGAGRSNKLDAGVIHAVPWSDGRQFTMDDSPGIEKLYLISSPTRLEELESLFDAETGNLSEGVAAGTLTARLVDYSDNAKVSIGKGITVESYGAGVDTGKAFMTEVDLAHYPNTAATQ